MIGNALGNAGREAIQGVRSKSTGKKWDVPSAGVGLMAFAPLAQKGLSKLSGEGALEDMGGKPIEQSTDVGAPLTTVYNQFTQFEEWPDSMHRDKASTPGAIFAAAIARAAAAGLTYKALGG